METPAQAGYPIADMLDEQDVASPAGARSEGKSETDWVDAAVPRLSQQHDASGG